MLAEATLAPSPPEGLSLAAPTLPANKTVSAKVSAAEKNALAFLSRKLGVSQSTLIRIAIRRLIVDYYKRCGGEDEGYLSGLVKLFEKSLEDYEKLHCRVPP
ncbi:hypothetical protein JCM10135_08830 [Stetteria hydrogenophila]